MWLLFNDTFITYTVNIETKHGAFSALILYVFFSKLLYIFFPIQVDAFKNRMVQFNSPYLDIAIGHYNSIDQEINKNVVGDIRLFAITILLMMSYAGIATLTSRLNHLNTVSCILSLNLV